MNLIGERKDPVKPQHKQSEYKSQQIPNMVQEFTGPYWMPDGNGGFAPCPMVLIEEELYRLLRITELSKAKNYHNVVVNLMRCHDLPCIHIGRQPAFPLYSIIDWIVTKSQKRG